MAPGAMVPMLQLSTWLPSAPLIEHAVPSCWSIDQSTVVPAGSGSDSVTPVAVPVPTALLLLTVMLKPIGLPAFTAALSAVLRTETSGHCTVVDAWLLATLPLLVVRLVAFAVALLVYVLQLEAVVPLTTCTCRLLPAAMSPKLQTSVCDGGLPPIEQGLPDGCEAMLQLTPVPAGRLSVSVT